MLKFLIIFNWCLFFSVSLHSQTGLNVYNLNQYGNSIVYNFKNEGFKKNTLFTGPGISSSGYPAFGLGYKFNISSNFRIGLNLSVFGAKVNNGANTTGMLLTSLTPEYRVYNYNKFSIGVSAGVGFVAGMYPLYCVSPGINLEYQLGKLVSLSLEPDYLIFQQKEARDINNNVITKININFNF